MALSISMKMWTASVVVVLCASFVISQQVARRTRFSCQGRVAGYYADIDTGCQVYHMCDGLGRQFSYTCPNTTLFQQRMLICDHWYMVNCSKAESDYDANLLIGQRDKPFVSEADMQQRTPRPDILNVPYNNNYYDGLKEAETKYPTPPYGNTIVGISDNSGLDSSKNQYRPPGSWTTGADQSNSIDDDRTGFKPSSTKPGADNLSQAASETSFVPTPNTQPNTNIATPSLELRPPSSGTHYTSSTVRSISNFNNNLSGSQIQKSSEEYDIDIRMKPETRPSQDPVVNFINKFDPDAPDSRKTAMSTSEILHLNSQLPSGPESSVEDSDHRSSQRKSFSTTNNFNNFEHNGKGVTTESTRFESVNSKPTSSEATGFGQRIPSANFASGVSTPERVLVPPKTEYSEQPSTTMGPPIYYDWKWAVPAFDLQPPNESNKTNTRGVDQATLQTSESGRPNFINSTRLTSSTGKSIDLNPLQTEYNISSYFVPDYVFPLDKPHPGYEESNAQSSFQVKLSRSSGTSYGENPKCPQCHPAYLKPGSCEPCIVRR